MSRESHITLTPGCSSGTDSSEPTGGSWSFDPGNDPTMPKVDDPGNDPTMPKVDDPGNDPTMPKVDDPDGIARALVRAANAYGFGGIGPGSIVIQQGGGGCCCKGEDSDTPPSTPPGKSAELSGFVIVRLAPQHGSLGFESLEALAQERGLRGLLELLRAGNLLPNARPLPADPAAGTTGDALGSWPLIFSCRGRAVRPRHSPGKRRSNKGSCRKGLVTLEKAAASSPYRPLRSLADYWRIDARALGAGKFLLVEELNALAEVEMAYCELAATDPSLNEGDFMDDQGYLEEAPMGIGATCVGPYLTPGSGTLGVHLIDLEQGWDLAHENLGLGPATFQPFGGANRLGHERHGTAVVGELIARRDSASSSPQIQGLLPDAAFSVASHYFDDTIPKKAGTDEIHPLQDTNGHVANAIVATLLGLSEHGKKPAKLRGKILLLEVQRGRCPTEIDDADFNAIRLATALGVTVVEAAGNRGANLDTYRHPTLGRIFNPKAAGFRHSGAILVGAAHARLPHDRAGFSNFGARIDCYAWGDQVTSTGFGNLYGSYTQESTDDYTNTFGGTSSASPIIAGAAAILQALSKQNTQSYLLPNRLRALLSDPETGTPQGPNVAGRIGVMPDLKAILEETACLAPDLYIRKDLCDDGSRRGPEILTSSPDIVLDHPPQQNPVQLYSDSARGWPFMPAIGFPPGKGSWNLYVRLCNRGVADPGKVIVRLFAGPAATLITPDRWTEIDPVTKPKDPKTVKVLPGDPLATSPVFVWNQASGGPHSFLAVAHPETLPEPALPPSGEYFDWRTYLAFMERKTVACRNIHVIPKNWAMPGRLPFEVTGTPDRARSFHLEILRRLPAGVHLDLEIPRALAAKLLQRQPWLEIASTPASTAKRTRLRLPPGACLRFPSIALPKGTCYPATFYLSGSGLEPGHSLALRQLRGGREIGRVSWNFFRDAPVNKNHYTQPGGVTSPL